MLAYVLSAARPVEVTYTVCAKCARKPCTKKNRRLCHDVFCQVMLLQTGCTLITLRSHHHTLTEDYFVQKVNVWKREKEGPKNKHFCAPTYTARCGGCGAYCLISVCMIRLSNEMLVLQSDLCQVWLQYICTFVKSPNDSCNMPSTHWKLQHHLLPPVFPHSVPPREL